MNVEVVKYLIEKGTNVNALAYLGGQTPMGVIQPALKKEWYAGGEVRADEIRKFLKAAGAEDAHGEI